MAENQLSDGRSDGVVLGQSETDLVAFHGAAPVDQRSGAAQAAVATTAATTSAYGYAQAQADAIVTLLNEIRATLVEKGLMKGAA
jgi:hypothetical protein